MKDFLKILGGAIVIAAIVFLGYLCFQFERKMNYSWSYRDMVKETIVEKVKPECLR